MPMDKLILEDHMVVHMSRDARYVAEFPFLKNVADARAAEDQAGSRPRSCGSCGGGGTTAHTDSRILAAKKQILSLDPQRKRRLLQKLGTKELYVPIPGGQSGTLKLGAA